MKLGGNGPAGWNPGYDVGGGGTELLRMCVENRGVDSVTDEGGLAWAKELL